MIKVLQICSSLTFGGTESYIMNIYRNIDRNKIQFHFLCFVKLDDSYEQEIKSLGGEVFYVFPPGIKKILSFTKMLVELERKERYSAVHAHVDNLNGILMLSSAISRIPVRISHVHSAFERKTENIFHNLYENFKKILVNRCSTYRVACSREAAKSIYGNRLQNVSVLKNGIDVEKFQKRNSGSVVRLREELEIPENAFVIGNITRFDKNKNQYFIVEIFIKLLEIIPNSILILGGTDGEEKERIINKIGEAFISEKVRILGVRQDIPSILQLFDYYVFPSKSEGLGIAVLETQAAGIPAIVSDTVPRLVDLELGLIKFEKLECSPRIWVDGIIDNNRSEIVDFNLIKQKFMDCGFDIKESVKEIEKIYLGDKRK